MQEAEPPYFWHERLNPGGFLQDSQAFFLTRGVSHFGDIALGKETLEIPKALDVFDIESLPCKQYS